MSILEGRVVKVSHSTRTAILQLVDPACQVAARAHVSRCGWETKPPLGFKSKASIFHAPARDSNSDRVERQLTVIGNAVVHTAGQVQG